MTFDWIGNFKTTANCITNLWNDEWKKKEEKLKKKKHPSEIYFDKKCIRNTCHARMIRIQMLLLLLLLLCDFFFFFLVFKSRPFNLIKSALGKRMTENRYAILRSNRKTIAQSVADDVIGLSRSLYLIGLVGSHCLWNFCSFVSCLCLPFVYIRWSHPNSVDTYAPSLFTLCVFISWSHVADRYSHFHPKKKYSLNYQKFSAFGRSQ